MTKLHDDQIEDSTSLLAIYARSWYLPCPKLVYLVLLATPPPFPVPLTVIFFFIRLSHVRC